MVAGLGLLVGRRLGWRGVDLSILQFHISYLLTAPRYVTNDASCVGREYSLYSLKRSGSTTLDLR